MLALRLMGEPRQACVENDTRAFTTDRNKEVVAGIRSGGWGATCLRGQIMCVSLSGLPRIPSSMRLSWYQPHLCRQGQRGLYGGSCWGVLRWHCPGLAFSVVRSTRGGGQGTGWKGQKLLFLLVTSMVAGPSSQTSSESQKGLVGTPATLVHGAQVQLWRRAQQH